MITYVILAPISVGRKELERIENSVFDSVEGLLADLGVECGVLTLSDFMDLVNNQDDDTPEKLKIDLNRLWFGYVRIKN